MDDHPLMRRRTPCFARAVLAMVLLATAPLATAEVRLHGYFGDHMVLQRDARVPVWGWAAAGEQVEVTFRQQTRRTRADREGRWSVWLGPEAAGGPDELVVRGHNTLRLRDILTGDVWLCAGQSNMAWLLKDSQAGPDEVVRADHLRIRHLKIAHRVSMQPLDDIEPAAWQPSQPRTAGDFTAIGYYFAKTLQAELGVPIGLVNAAWGGTHIETWMSREALRAHRELRGLVADLPQTPGAYVAHHRERSLAQVRRWQADAGGGGDPAAWSSPAFADQDWRELDAPAIWESQGLDGFDGTLWYRRTVELAAAQAGSDARLQLGMIDDCDETFVNGTKVGSQCGWNTPRRYDLAPGQLQPGRNVVAVRVTDQGGGGGFHGAAGDMKLALGRDAISLAGRWKARIEAPLAKSAPDVNDLPSLAFNAMLNPLAGTAMRGVLWYQGESNVTRAAQYAESFPLFIADLRRRWGQGNLPFLFVQLAAFLPVENNTLAGSQWAELRDAQRATLSVRNTGMAVTTDIGDADDIHPRNKREVGLRLARIALKHTYRRQWQASGPVPGAVRRVGDHMEVRFTSVSRGLVLKGERLEGFTVADSSRQFHPAMARIAGPDLVHVWSPGVRRPQAVRFGWVDNPQADNLFNSEGLPASPFRTDNWPRLTDGKSFAF